MHDGTVVAAQAPTDRDPAARRAAAREDAWKRFARAGAAQEYCQSWLALQALQVGDASDGVVLLRLPGQDTLAPAAYLPQQPHDRALFSEVIERALAERRGVVLPRLPRTANLAPGELPGEAADQPLAYQLALPLQVDDQLVGAVGLEIAPRDDAGVRAAMRELQWGAGWLELWLRRQSASGAEAAGGHARVRLALDAVANLLEHARLKDGGPALVTALATRLGCDRVALGLAKGGRCRLQAVSHSSQVSANANLARALELAMDEALDQRTTLGWPLEGEAAAAPLVRLAQQQLLQASGGGSVLTLPLLRGNRVVGALLLERAAALPFDPATVDLCEGIAAVAGPLVGLQVDAARGLAAHAVDRVAQARDALLGPDHAGWKLGGAAALIVLLLLAFVDGQHRVTADAAVEGTLQRALSAPINGFVREARHRAGDSVKSGVLIARLDDRDLQVERTKLLSQAEQYSSQYREASATRERAHALMASAQLEQARAQLALVDEQIARAALVAPFDAVILSGDLSQKLGSPVERGQALFELAPLDSFRVAVFVDEHDFAHVRTGQVGTLTVNSMPGTSFGFTVTKITAVNEARDGRNLFRVEATLSGDKGRLRPGMKGVGKVHIGERRLVWIWTHALVDRIRLWLWQRLP